MFLTIINYIYSSIYFTISCVYFIITMLHSVLPWGMDVGALAVATYFMTRLKKSDPRNVVNIFGPLPGTKESEIHPDKVVRCIAHRGAALDAPENTMEAFKYCIDHDCKFVELDVRTCRDGKLIVLHDQGLERLTGGSSITNIRATDWESLQKIDVGAKHPNREKFKEVHLCLLDEAIDYLLANKARMIIDVKGEDKEVIDGVIKLFRAKPALYDCAAVTCFNPFVLYQIRKRDPQIVGALSYRPYAFSAIDYDAQNGPSNPRFGDNMIYHGIVRALDVFYGAVWRWSARWCGVGAVLLHKDIVSPKEVHYWRSLGIRCAGWSVNRPVEKLYWRGVLKAPYLANTLLGEPDMEESKSPESTEARPAQIVDSLLQTQQKSTMRQHL